MELPQQNLFLYKTKADLIEIFYVNVRGLANSTKLIQLLEKIEKKIVIQKRSAS